MQNINFNQSNVAPNFKGIYVSKEAEKALSKNVVKNLKSHLKSDALDLHINKNNSSMVCEMRHSMTGFIYKFIAQGKRNASDFVKLIQKEFTSTAKEASRIEV